MAYAPQGLAEGISVLAAEPLFSGFSQSGAAALPPPPQRLRHAPAHHSRAAGVDRCGGGDAPQAARALPPAGAGGLSRPRRREPFAPAASAARRWAMPAISPQWSRAANSISGDLLRPMTRPRSPNCWRSRELARWSAEIYLIFALGRPDIWPAADLGLQIAVGRRLGLGSRASEPTCAAGETGGLALGRRLPFLAILSACPQPDRPASAGGSLCLKPAGRGGT